MELKYQGLTNSQRFVNSNNEVDLESAFNAYTNTKMLVKDLQSFIEQYQEGMDEEKIVAQMEHYLQYYADMFYTLYQGYKDNKIKTTPK